MTAITVTKTTIANAAIDADSPITVDLMTALRDNIEYVYQWLGASFTAGAEQDHNHDGVNSSLIEVGPNLARNGSFESGESGWTFTDYSGGSHAANTANDMHGATAMAFTSTVLANGGGDAISASFTACGESDTFIYTAYIKASVANVSSRFEVIWYDDAQSQISATQLVNLTNTPTGATRYAGQVSPPANARYFKLRVTGGVPAAGSATGTVYFDGVEFRLFALENSFVNQAHLKSTTGAVGTSNTSPTLLTLPGGTYGFYPQTQRTASVTVTATIANAANTSSYTTNISLNASSSATVNAQQRYIQASPPYDLGNGEVPLFVFGAVDAGGNLVATYEAPDPPWANNGPTDIRAQFRRAGRAFRRRPLLRLDPAKLQDPALADTHMAEVMAAGFEEIEITQALKQADMPLIPHPFPGVPGMAQAVMLDPFGRLCSQLCKLRDQGEPVLSLFAREYVQIDNTPLAGMNAPPGVLPVRARWKNTA